MDIQHLIPSELSGDGQTFDTIRNDHGALREYREYDQIHIDALSTSRNGSMLYPEYVDLSAYHSQVIQEPPQKEDNELRNAAAHGFNRGQSIQDTISITIIDSEGPRIYFQKSYRLGTKTSIKKALDQIRSHVCTTCSSNPQLLEFWYETTKLENGQTAALLNMQPGDTIDIRLKETCTRGGAHPLPTSQTTPNMHYLDVGVFSAVEEDFAPPAPKETMTLTFRNDTKFSMTFRLGMDFPIRKACEAFEVRLGLGVGGCRFHAEGEKVDRGRSLRELELEDSDIIEAYTELIGGGGAFPQRSSSHPGNFSNGNTSSTREPSRVHSTPTTKPSPSSTHHPTHKPLPSPPSSPLSPSSSSSEPSEIDLIHQISLLFRDEYNHTFQILFPTTLPLLKALDYAAFRMGKNASNCSFEIRGTRIDLEVLGSKTPVDLGIHGHVEVKVWWDLSGKEMQTEPDDGLMPRSVRLGTRPALRQVGGGGERIL